MASTELTVDVATERIQEVIEEIEGAVILDREFLDTIMVGLLASGHVLLEDVPGTGKTLTANSLASTLGLEFSRIQFTPDLLPNDVTGTYVYNEKIGEFEFQEGPIFGNIILADEINRAPPKTQAALLEAMGEGQVTVEGTTHELPDPFFVIATQNPVEQEGTFVLPEAQVDRFMIKSSIGYPESDGLLTLLRRRADRTSSAPSASRVLEPGEVKQLQNVTETITVDDDMLEYIVQVTQATQEDHRVRVGISPRGVQRLFEAVRARAVVDGRDYVTPGDVKAVSGPGLAHRLVLTAEAQVNDVDKREIIDEILSEVPVPTIKAPN